MDIEFYHTDLLARLAASFGYDVVVETNRRVVVRCATHRDACGVVATLRNEVETRCEIKRGLKSDAWYVQAW